MQDQDQDTSFSHRDFSGGMATNLNPSLAPRSTVKLLLNMDADEEIGSAVSRLGSAAIGSQLVDNMPVLGLHQHVDGVTPGNNKLLAAINASGGATSVIKLVSDGSDEVTGLTASKKMRFLTYLGSTLAINGADAERAWNGANWITTGGVFDLANFPGSNSCELAAEFLDRIYTAGDDSNPDRLYYSTISDGTQITWDGDYIDIEPEDGGGRITALAKVPGYMLIFKERSMKRFNGQSAFPESLVNIGAPSQECVASSGGLCAFFSSSNENARGFYITNGGRPQPVSHDATRTIKKWVDAIPQASEAGIAAYAVGERAFGWSVGDLTVDGVEYPNVHLRYNHTLNQWSVRSYPTAHRAFASYLVSGANALAAGDEDGNVIHLDKPGTYTDAPGTLDIAWALETQPRTFGTLRRKTVSDRVALAGENLGDPSASVVTDADAPAPFHKKFVKSVLALFGVNAKATGTYVSFRVQGRTKSARAVLREIEPTTITLSANYAE